MIAEDRHNDTIVGPGQQQNNTIVIAEQQYLSESAVKSARIALGVSCPIAEATISQEESSFSSKSIVRESSRSIVMQQFVVAA